MTKKKKAVPWYKRHPEQVLANGMAWRKKNRKRWLELQRKHGRIRYARLKKEAFDALGDKCNKCGYDNIEVLQVDHRAGGGKKHYRKCNGADKFYRDVAKTPSKFQLLCPTCNWEKRLELKESTPRKKAATGDRRKNSGRYKHK